MSCKCRTVNEINHGSHPILTVFFHPRLDLLGANPGIFSCSYGRSCGALFHNHQGGPSGLRTELTREQTWLLRSIEKVFFFIIDKKEYNMRSTINIQGTQL